MSLKHGGKAKKYKGKEMEREKKINKKLEYKWHFLFFSRLFALIAKSKRKRESKHAKGLFVAIEQKEKKPGAHLCKKRIYMLCTCIYVLQSCVVKVFE